MKHRLVQSIEFTPVDPKYVRVVVIRTIISWLIFIIPAIALAAFLGSLSFPGLIWWIVVVLLIGGFVWNLWLSVRQAKAVGYAELDEELLVRHGILFQKVCVVPYGRMQQVQLGTGPLLSKYGLAKIELVTAAAGTDASIPGVKREEAERLRERLTALGNANLEGL